MHCLLRCPPPFFGTVFGLSRFAAWHLAKVSNVNLTHGAGGGGRIGPRARAVGGRFRYWCTLAQRLGICWFVAALMPVVPSANGATTGPNIVFIMADDLRYDALGYTGNPVLQTPNIDHLAARGTSFTPGVFRMGLFTDANFLICVIFS